jgi:hypothetical protein
MQQAPGYKKLIAMCGAPIIPTPAAVGDIIERVAKKEQINVLGVDIGGATTDVFSVFQKVFNRTVSANLGMSYSISNVLAEAGLDNILRWVPIEIDEQDLRNRIKNKMIRPTTIPFTVDELMIEQAIAREALRLALDQHKLLAVGLKGVQQERSISDAFEQQASGQSLINMMDLNLVIGSGGILSHAPRRVQSMVMMTDSYQLEGITRLAVDSIFMMPHLGVLATVNEKAATDAFEHDCMVYLGTCIAPVGVAKEGEKCLDIRLTGDGLNFSESIAFGEIRLLKLDVGKTAKMEATPAKGFDLGAGKGKPVSATIHGGVGGVLIDTRGRPLQLPQDRKARVAVLKKWAKAVELYPEVK